MQSFLIIHDELLFECAQTEKYKPPIATNQITDGDFNVIEGVMFYPFFRGTAYENSIGSPYFLVIRVYKSSITDVVLNKVCFTKSGIPVELTAAEFNERESGDCIIYHANDKIDIDSKQANIVLRVYAEVNNNQHEIDFNFSRKHYRYITGPIN
jgi:hypothetical protein